MLFLKKIISILAWRIPWTEEPGRLQSMGLQKVRHNLVTFTHCILNRLQYSVKVTFYALGNQKKSITHFVTVFALLWSSEPEMSQKYACIQRSLSFCLSMCKYLSVFLSVCRSRPMCMFHVLTHNHISVPISIYTSVSCKVSTGDSLCLKNQRTLT